MSKEYFPHDFAARLSLRDVRKDFGMVGVGVYWCIVEILHEEGGYIKENDLAGIAYDLQVELDLCQAITHNYDLFAVKKGKIFSERVLRNLNKRQEISLARSKAATSRWDGRNRDKTVSKDTEKSEYGSDKEVAASEALKRLFDIEIDVPPAYPFEEYLKMKSELEKSRFAQQTIKKLSQLHKHGKEIVNGLWRDFQRKNTGDNIIQQNYDPKQLNNVLKSVDKIDPEVEDI